MASSESSMNLVRGPARRPEWAQMIRLGGDRVAVLFNELRKSVGKIDGIIERLHYSAEENRWVVKYSIDGLELFTARIFPGSLEAEMALSAAEANVLLRSEALSRTLRNTIDSGLQERQAGLINFPLTNRRAARSFASLVRAKSRLGHGNQL